jgi:hypothetical protein
MVELVSSLKKEESDMDQKASDPRWQQLQAHIEGFLGQALRNGMRSIEYKPRFIVPLWRCHPSIAKTNIKKRPHEGHMVSSNI